MRAGFKSWVIWVGIGALVALYVGFASFSLVCDLHHGHGRSEAPAHSRHTANHALCALAHGSIAAIPVASIAILAVGLFLAPVAGFPYHGPSPQSPRSKRSRAPPA